MNIDPNRFTEMAIMAINNCSSIARNYKNQELETLHLFKSLIEQEKPSIVLSILDGLDIQQSAIVLSTDKELQNLPKISGSYDENRSYITSSLNDCLADAEKISNELGDDFISTEHLLLALIKVSKPAGMERIIKSSS